MTKKILSIFAVVCLSVIVAPSVFAADADTCGGTTGVSCTSPETCVKKIAAGSFYSCEFTCGTVNPQNANDVGDWCSTGSCIKAGTSPNFTYSCPGGGTVVNSLLSGPSECIRVGSNFKMKLTQDNSSVRVLSWVRSGAIIAAGAVDKTNCPYVDAGNSNQILETTKCNITVGDAATNGIRGGERCVLPKASEIGIVGMLSIIYTVTNWIFYILTLVAVAMIVYGGFTYIAAAGDPAKATKGKTVLTLSIIGLTIALLAKFIPTLVKFILGV